MSKVGTGRSLIAISISDCCASTRGALLTNSRVATKPVGALPCVKILACADLYKGVLAGAANHRAKLVRPVVTRSVALGLGVARTACALAIPRATNVTPGPLPTNRALAFLVHPNRKKAASRCSGSKARYDASFHLPAPEPCGCSDAPNRPPAVTQCRRPASISLGIDSRFRAPAQSSGHAR
jgi:hypothetical protein